MNILIIRFSSMGDVILATSVFSYLKSEYPDSRIWFITGKIYSDLFSLDNRIYRVISYEKGKEKNIIEELKNVTFDKIIDLQNSPKSLFIRKHLFSSQSPLVFKKLYFKRLLLLLTRINLYKKENNIVARYIKTVDSKINCKTFLPPPKIIIDNTINIININSNILSGSFVRPIIALFPFSAWKNKKWPASYFKVVGKYFALKGWNIIIAGGPQDIEESEKLKKSIGNQCFSIAGLCNLKETAYIISKCNLALGNDTGFSHLARACGVKTGIIYGSTTYHWGFYPYGKPSYRIFEKNLFCRPCHPHGGNFCFLFNRICLKRIYPEDVIKGLLELSGEK